MLLALAELGDEWVDGGRLLVAAQLSQAPRVLARGPSDEPGQPTPKLAHGSDTSTLSSRTVVPVIPIGSDVIFQGLASRTDLAEHVGTVESVDGEALRYAVRVQFTEERVRVKMQNLRRLISG